MQAWAVAAAQAGDLRPNLTPPNSSHANRRTLASLPPRSFRVLTTAFCTHDFMGSSLSDMYRKPALGKKTTDMSDDELDIDIAKLLKDAELFGASTWKERKKIENRKVVELGGKAIKKHRTPLSVAKPAMKNQNKREQRKIEEERLFGIFRKRDTKNGKAQKTRPEDRVLRATEGCFKNGILDVKHLLAPPKPSGGDAPEQKMRKGKKKGKGKQKGGRRKRR